MDFLSALNPEQQEAVNHTEGALLILAGAGSGKTRVIAHRIAHLVANGFAESDRVLAVTFTNKAAEEMRTRVETLLGVNCRAMWISTFHALCARLLRREAPNIGLSRDFVIYDSSDQQAVIKQLLKEYRLDDSTYQPRAVLSQISHAKNQMEGPDDVREELEPARPGGGAALRGLPEDAEGRERARLRRSAAQGRRALRPGAGGARALRAQVPLLMVDEYQDTNRPQYLLVKQLASAHRNLCVVGDPGPVDLQVARRRPAQHPRLRARFSRSGRRAAGAQLPVDAGDSRRRVGGDREQPQPQREDALDRPQGRRQDHVLPRRRRARRGRLTSRVSRARRFPRTSNAMMAVLYRTNAQSRALEDALRQANIGYVVLGGVGFYERKEIKDALSYLKLILNPHDDLALRRVINVPARGIGKGVMDALEQVNAGEARRTICRRSSPVSRRRWRPIRCGRSWSPRPSERLLNPRQVASLAAFRDLDHRPGRHGAARIGVHRARQGARSVRVPARSPRGPAARSPRAASRT